MQTVCYNKNDRISKTAYLKLLFTKLPFNKCMFIDPDTLINGNLYNIFIAKGFQMWYNLVWNDIPRG